MKQVYAILFRSQSTLWTFATGCYVKVRGFFHLSNALLAQFRTDGVLDEAFDNSVPPRPIICQHSKGLKREGFVAFEVRGAHRDDIDLLGRSRCGRQHEKDEQ